MKERGSRKSLAGTVVGNKMQKTAVVRVERLTKHRAYGKFIKTHSNYMAHDPQNSCQIGDKVRIVESRPISKKKRWQVVETISKAIVEN